MPESKEIEWQPGSKKTKQNKTNKQTKKTKAYNVLSREDSPWAKDTYKLKVRGWKKIFHASGQDRKAGVETLIQTKHTLKQRLILHTPSSICYLWTYE